MCYITKVYILSIHKSVLDGYSDFLRIIRLDKTTKDKLWLIAGLIFLVAILLGQRTLMVLCACTTRESVFCNKYKREGL